MTVRFAVALFIAAACLPALDAAHAQQVPALFGTPPGGLTALTASGAGQECTLTLRSQTAGINAPGGVAVAGGCVVVPDDNTVPARIQSFRLNETDGTLTLLDDLTVPDNSGASDVAASPDGDFMIVAHRFSGDLSVLSVDQATCALSEVQAVSTLDQGQPTSIDISPDGLLVAVTYIGSSIVGVYDRDPGTGMLTFLDAIDLNDIPELAVLGKSGGANLFPEMPLFLDGGLLLIAALPVLVALTMVDRGNGRVVEYLKHHTVSEFAFNVIQRLDGQDIVVGDKNSSLDVSGARLMTCSVDPGTGAATCETPVSLGAGTFLDKLITEEGTVYAGIFNFSMGRNEVHVLNGDTFEAACSANVGTPTFVEDQGALGVLGNHLINVAFGRNRIDVLEIGGGSVNIPPLIQSVTADPASGPPPLNVHFTAHVTDANNDPITYTWDFGEGTTSNEASPSHTYTTEGSYTVTLTVDDGHGGSDEAVTTVEVTAPGVVPRDQAKNLVIDLVPEVCPDPDQALAFLRQELLEPGDRIETPDGEVDITIEDESYFAWINCDKQALFAHDNDAFLIINTELIIAEPTLDIIDTEWWAEINGEGYLDGFQERLDTPDLVYGLAFELPEIDIDRIVFNPIDVPVGGSGTCAFLVSGEGNDNTEQEVFDRNVERVKAELTTEALGPQLSESNIIELKNPTGSQLRSALAAAAGQYDKIYFYYGGHGDRGGMVLNNAFFLYSELAGLLYTSGADDLYVILDACYSGSAEADFRARSEFEGTNLTLLTSSHADKVSYHWNNKETGLNVFTWFLLESFGNPAVEFDGVEGISLEEAFVGVETTDPEIPGLGLVSEVMMPQLIIHRVSPLEPPAAVSNLTATAVGPNRIDLHWSDNSVIETGFRIECRIAGGLYTTIATVGAGITTFSDTSVEPDTEYEYRVIAFNDVGEAPPSNVASVTTPTEEPEAPAAPTDVQASVAGHDEVVVSWQDNADNEDTYCIQRKEAGAPDEDFETVGEVEKDTQVFFDGTVEARTTYEYRVIAKNDTGASAPSNTDDVTTLGRAPGGTANHEAAGTTNDPINTFTGELFFTAPPALVVRAPLPLVFGLYYGSLLNRDGRVQSTLGPNWAHTYDWRLDRIGNEAVEVVSDQGRVTTFRADGDTWEQVSNRDRPLQLAEDGTGFALGDPRTGLVRSFDAEGRLTEIADGRGNSLALTYDGAGLLQKVADGLGHALTFGYDGPGRLTSASDGTRIVRYTYDADGLLAGFTNAAGETTTYTYDTGHSIRGLLVAETSPEGNARYTQVFDAEGRVVAQTDALGNTTTLAYDGAETRVTNPQGDTFTHTHTPEGLLTGFEDVTGRRVELSYDEMGQRDRVTDRLGGVIRRTYDPATGLLTSVTRANGGTTTHTYAPRTVAANQAAFTAYDLSGITYADGTSINITRDAGGNPTRVTDRAGQVWTFTYNERGQVLTATSPKGSTTTTTYAAGRPATVTDAAGSTARFTFDAPGRLTGLTRPDGATVAFTYDDADRLLSMTDEEGRTTTFTYDANGNRMQVTDPSGNSATFSYDARDHLVQATDRVGGVTTFGYDAPGRLRSTTDPNGSTVTRTYDALGRLVGLTDGGGFMWTMAYDAEGVLTQITDPTGQSTTYTSDAMGWITRATDPMGHATGFSRDVLGRVISVQDPLGEHTGIARDVRGLPVQATLPGGASAVYARDALGLIEQVTDPNGGAWQYTRDVLGRLAAVTDPLGRATAYAYDDRHRVSQITLPGGGTAAFTYDRTSRLTDLAYSDGTRFAYTRDANGRLIGTDGVTLARDAAGRITESNGLAVGRDAGGRVTSVTYASEKTVTYTYDGRGLVTGVADWLAGTTTLTYDAAGHLTNITRPNGTAMAYTYDGAGRLTGVEESQTESAPVLLAASNLVRDARGQITSATHDVPLAPSQSPDAGTWTVDAAGQLDGTDYDPLGHLTGDAARTYTWDLASRLTSYTESAETIAFTYDAFGNRLTRTAGGTARDYIWNYALGLPSVAVERQGGEDARYHVHTPAGRLLYSIDADGSRRFYHYDEMGNTRFVTDDAGAVIAAYAYSPYGQVLAETGDLDNPFTWQGAYGVMREGNRNLYYVRARYYDAATRRFLSRDPIRSLHPAEVTPYQYARGNPQRFVDPTGLDPDEYARVRASFEEKGRFAAAHLSLYFGAILFKEEDGMTHIDPPSLQLDAGGDSLVNDRPGQLFKSLSARETARNECNPNVGTAAEDSGVGSRYFRLLSDEEKLQRGQIVSPHSSWSFLSGGVDTTERGYITIDTPTNVLWGDYLHIDPSSNFALPDEEDDGRSGPQDMEVPVLQLEGVGPVDTCEFGEFVILC